MSKQLKSLMREQIRTRFKSVDGGLFISTMGLNSEKTYAFRKAMRARRLRYAVVRNAFAREAFKLNGFADKDLAKVFVGPVGILYTSDEGSAAAGARGLLEWKKEAKDKIVQIKGAFIEGAILGAKDAEALKNAPTKDQARAQLAGALQAPIVKLAATLKEMYARLAYALGDLERKRGEAGGAAAGSAS